MNQQFICEGDKIVKELLQNPSYNIDFICALPTWLQKNDALIPSTLLNVLEVNGKILKKISNLKTPNDVLAVVDIPENALDSQLIDKQPCLYLDALQDPGNLGTILRIADWFGIPYLFLSSNTVEIYNPKVIQASMGAFLRVKTKIIEIEELKQLFPNKAILGADMGGENIFQADLPKDAIVVIGNEGNGISENNRQWLDQIISIPKGNNGGAESLNAAVATGIISAWMSR
ncbi:MAG: RNA methyltransferase [Bacteroidota bacterium]